MFVNGATTELRNFLESDTGTPPTHMGVGIGTTASAGGNTALANEVYPTTSRNELLITRAEDTLVFRMTQATDEGSTASYSEHGLFTNSTTGTMWTRQTHPDTDKDVNTVTEHIISLKITSDLL